MKKPSLDLAQVFLTRLALNYRVQEYTVPMLPSFPYLIAPANPNRVMISFGASVALGSVVAFKLPSGTLMPWGEYGGALTVIATITQHYQVPTYEWWLTAAPGAGFASMGIILY